MTTTPCPKAISFSLMPTLIIVQTANQSCCSLFALLHGKSTVTGHKQCVCCRLSKHNLYVYILLPLNCYRIIECFIFEFSCKHGWNLYVHYLMCVSSFLDYYVTYCYNLLFSWCLRCRARSALVPDGKKEIGKTRRKNLLNS